MIEIEEPQKRLPFSQLLLYGTGNMASSLLGWGVIVFQPVFNLMLGVSPALVGMAFSLPRLVDLFTDPLAGYLSDSLRRRFSRSFFIALGSVFGGLLFALLWLFPNGFSPYGYFAWILAFLSAALVGWSFLSVPLQALAFEMSEKGEDRISLMAYSTFMGNGVLMLGGWAYVAAQSRFFKSTITGVHWVAGAMAAMIVGFGLITALGCKGKSVVEEVRLTPSDRARTPGFKDFVSAAKRMSRNQPFMLLVGAIALICFGCFSATVLSQYICIYYVKGGDQFQGMILYAAGGNANGVAALVATAFVPWLARKIGRKNALVSFLGVAFVGNALKWLCYSRTLPWLVLIPNATFGGGLVALWVLIPSMVADISDSEEARIGTQDAGLFSAFYLWTVKVSYSLVNAVGGLLLVCTGFNVAYGPSQSHHTIVWMRIFDFACPALALAGGMALISRYSITDAEMASVRETLAQRRAGKTSSA